MENEKMPKTCLRQGPKRTKTLAPSARIRTEPIHLRLDLTGTGCRTPRQPRTICIIGTYTKATGRKGCLRQKEFKADEDSASGGEENEEKRLGNDCELADEGKV